MLKVPPLQVRFAILIVVTLSSLQPAKLVAWQSTPLARRTESLPQAMAGAHYRVNLQSGGGIAPFTWQLADGSKLPPGLKLHRQRGIISGTPATPGEYHFTIAVSDVDSPPNRVQRDFTLVVVAGLTIQWGKPPKVSGTWIAGSLMISNHTDHALDLTVIVVAVNDISRATALGYQHFTLQSQAEQEIPFGANPGPGSYVVNADAVAAGPGGKASARADLRTNETSPLRIEQF